VAEIFFTAKNIESAKKILDKGKPLRYILLNQKILFFLLNVVTLATAALIDD